MIGAGPRRLRRGACETPSSCVRVGKVAVQDQVRDFLERCVPGEVLDRVTAVAETAGDRADRRFAGDDAFEAGAVDFFGHGSGRGRRSKVGEDRSLRVAAIAEE